MLSQFTGSTDFLISDIYTADTFLYNLGDSKEIPSHIQKYD